MVSGFRVSVGWNTLSNLNSEKYILLTESDGTWANVGSAKQPKLIMNINSRYTFTFSKFGNRILFLRSWFNANFFRQIHEWFFNQFIKYPGNKNGYAQVNKKHHEFHKFRRSWSIQIPEHEFCYYTSIMVGNV